MTYEAETHHDDTAPRIEAAREEVIGAALAFFDAPGLGDPRDRWEFELLRRAVDAYRTAEDTAHHGCGCTRPLFED